MLKSGFVARNLYSEFVVIVLLLMLSSKLSGTFWPHRQKLLEMQVQSCFSWIGLLVFNLKCWLCFPDKCRYSSLHWTDLSRLLCLCYSVPQGFFYFCLWASVHKKLKVHRSQKVNGASQENQRKKQGFERDIPSCSQKSWKMCLCCNALAHHELYWSMIICENFYLWLCTTGFSAKFWSSW